MRYDFKVDETGLSFDFALMVNLFISLSKVANLV